MTFKLCKYQCQTEIEWDTQLNAFREHDGKLHDRKRCEGIRNNGSSGSGSQAQANQTQQIQQQQPIVSKQEQLHESRATYDVAQTLNNILNAVQADSNKLTLLSKFYGDLLDHERETSRIIREIHKLLVELRPSLANDPQEQEMVEAEARHDQEKEDGTFNV